jgi:hypothetical protein
MFAIAVFFTSIDHMFADPAAQMTAACHLRRSDLLPKSHERVRILLLAPRIQLLLWNPLFC